MHRPAEIERLRAALAEAENDVAWEASVRHALLESQERLVKQRQGLKNLLLEALDIISREPGLDLETRQRIADWAKRCDKAFREFGQ
jgi:hypothetical protein